MIYEDELKHFKQKKQNMETSIIAKVCHEVNKAFCEANGDTSQKSWEEAEQWQKESAIKGVDFALTGTATPSDQHDAWVKDKIDAGWVYGEAKDAEKKTHPCIVPYDELPEFQKTKDHLFLAVVRSLS